MTKLSDIQLILLSTAATRPDGSLLPFAGSIANKDTRAQTTILALLRRALVREVDTTAADQLWRKEGDRNIGLAITAAGRAAIGIEEPGTDAAGAAPTEVASSLARPTKSGKVLDLLRRTEGATLAELVDATSWLPHTTRAALTGLRKKGHVIGKGKRGNETCYSIASA